MKVAFLFDDCMGLGGSQRVINNLANYFSKNYRYDVTIINYIKKIKEDNFSYDKNVKIVYLDNKRKEKPIKKYLTKRMREKKIKEFILANKFDIVIGISAHANIILGKIGKGIGSKLIGTEHVSYDRHSFKTKMRKRLYYPNLDKLAVLTDYDYGKYTVFLKNVVKIENSIPDEFKAEGYNAESKKIMAAGRLTEQKGFDMLIKSMPAVIQKHPDWCLDIYGEGQDENSLVAIIKEKKLEKNVQIKKFSKEIHKLMKNYSFFVLSSRYEGFGLVIAEAQSTGLPVVSFNCKTGPGEIINDGKDGILVEPENVGELSAAIIKMIENGGKKREGISENAVKNAKRFKIDDICEKWKILFEELLKERRG